MSERAAGIWAHDETVDTRRNFNQHISIPQYNEISLTYPHAITHRKSTKWREY